MIFIEYQTNIIKVLYFQTTSTNLPPRKLPKLVHMDIDGIVAGKKELQSEWR
jgi:hypothetical protein